MNLTRWLAEGKLKPHQAKPEEIEGLLSLVARDIENASVPQLTPDWRFSIAYNAALNLATIPLLVAGYRTVPSQGGHHYITISALTDTMGKTQKERVRFLNACRSKRHTSTYDSMSLITHEEADELIAEVKAFEQDLLAWISQPDNLNL